MLKFLHRFDFLPIVVLILFIVGTFVIWYVYNDYVLKKNYDLFDHETELIKLKIQQRLVLYAQILESGRAFFEVSNDIQRSDWKTFVEAQNIQQRYPGIQGVGFTKHTLNEDEFLNDMQELRDESLLNREISNITSDGAYDYIFFLEPPDNRNLKAYGYDMTSESNRRLAIERARDSNDFALSGKVTLVQEITEEKQFGFLLYLPIYHHGKEISTIDERRDNLLGFVYQPFRVGDFMNAILDENNKEIAVSIFDQKLSDDNLMYQNTKSENLNSIFNKESEVDIYGHTWIVSFQSGDDIIPFIDSLVGNMILVMGLTISIIYFFIIRYYRKYIVKEQTYYADSRNSSNKKFKIPILFVTSGILVLLMWYVVILPILENPDDLIELTSQNIGIIQTRDDLGSELSEPVVTLFDWYRKIDHKDGLTYSMTTTYLARDIKNDEDYWKLTIPESMNAYTRSYTDKPGYVIFPNHLEMKSLSVYDLGGEVIQYDFLRKIDMNGLPVYVFEGSTTFDISAEYPEFSPYPVYEDYATTANVEPITGIAVAYEERFTDYAIVDGNRIPILTVENWPTDFSQNNLINTANQFKTLYFFYEWIVPLVIVTVFALSFLIYWLVNRIVLEIIKTNFLIASDKQKNQMVSMINHEIKNPLTPIFVSVDTLLSDKTEPLTLKQKNRVEIIKTNTARINSLLSDYTDLKNFEMNKIKIQKITTDIKDLLESEISKFGTIAELKKIDIALNMGDSWSVNVDPTRIKQVIFNLLKNSSDFVPNNSGKITIYAKKQGNQTSITIEDNGKGIPTSESEKIFDEFYRIADSNYVRQGSGLGLSICKKIIDAHDGKIWADASYSNGAKFIILLPD